MSARLSINQAADELAQEIAAAQAELAAATAHAGMADDPYGRMMRAQSLQLSALYNILTTFQREMVSAQPRFDADSLRTLAAHLRPDVQQLARVVQFKTIVIAALALIAVLIAASAGTYLVARAEWQAEVVAVKDGLASLDVSAPSAATALKLLRLNDLARQLAMCRPFAAQDGSSACSMDVRIAPAREPAAALR